jgi:hypothetical protein
MKVSVADALKTNKLKRNLDKVHAKWSGKTPEFFIQN